MIIKPKKIAGQSCEFERDSVIDPTVKLVGKALINHVIRHRDNPLITYKELSQLCEGKLHYHHELDQPLGRLSALCKERNLPPISCVVYRQQEGLPGAGFYKEFFPGASQKDWDKIFIKCVKEVQACEQWEELLEGFN